MKPLSNEVQIVLNRLKQSVNPENLWDLHVLEDALRQEPEAAVPVAYIFKHPSGKLFWALTDESNKGRKDVMPVYTAPPAQPVAVPECFPELREASPGRILSRDDIVWNNAVSVCRAAMLNQAPVKQPASNSPVTKNSVVLPKEPTAEMMNAVASLFKRGFMDERMLREIYETYIKAFVKD